MNTYLEDLIRDAQERQAGRAVPPERILAKLPPRPARAARTRGRGTLVVAVACTAALVLAAVPVVMRLAGRPGVSPPVGWSGTVPDFARLPPPQEVWPEAVRRLPTRLPDGSTYRLRVSLGAGRYLVQGVGEDPGVAYQVGPKVFDSVAGTVRALGDPKAASADGTWLQDVTVAGGEALWVLQQGTSRFDVWSAPLDGSAKARLAVRWPGPGEAYPIGVHGGTLYWASRADRPPTGIYRMPLSGGAPQLVPGSERFRAYGRFPWVTTEPLISSLVVLKPGQTRQRTGELLNVVTGERIPWTANPGAAAVECDPVLCFGWSDDGRTVVQRPDGSAFTKLSYHQTELWREQSAFEGRIGVGTVYSVPATSWIWNRATGAAAALAGVTLEPIGGSFGGTLVQWTAGNDAVYALDLAEIR